MAALGTHCPCILSGESRPSKLPSTAVSSTDTPCSAIADSDGLPRTLPTARGLLLGVSDLPAQLILLGERSAVTVI